MLTLVFLGLDFFCCSEESATSIDSVDSVGSGTDSGMDFAGWRGRPLLPFTRLRGDPSIESDASETVWFDDEGGADDIMEDVDCSSSDLV